MDVDAAAHHFSSSQLAQDQADMAREFTAFRTRLLGGWIISNVSYVSIILHFDYLREFGLALAMLIFWSLFFRMAGAWRVLCLARIVRCCEMDVV